MNVSYVMEICKVHRREEWFNFSAFLYTSQAHQTRTRLAVGKSKEVIPKGTGFHPTKTALKT